jgi:hypothetical protein
VHAAPIRLREIGLVRLIAIAFNRTAGDGLYPAVLGIEPPHG